MQLSMHTTYQVICQKNFGTIELPDAILTCPNCHRQDTIVPVTVGFKTCKYRFHGINGNGQQYIPEWKDVTEDDLYQLFRPSMGTLGHRISSTGFSYFRKRRSSHCRGVQLAGTNEHLDNTEQPAHCLNFLKQMTSVQFGELPFHSEDTSVRSCAYSLDGKSFAVALQRRYQCVYDIKLGKAQKEQITSGRDDKSVRIWDVVTEDCRKVFNGHTRGVLSVACSPSGNQVSSSNADSSVRLWDLETEECSRILSSHTVKACEVAYSPNGDQLASVSADQTVQLFDTETGK
ncbi:MAG: WD40-repeat-containing domain protein [Benniella sp.]|nr:MAG: WD40-repeat-containing domain protein [Benniella sp.]